MCIDLMNMLDKKDRGAGSLTTGNTITHILKLLLTNQRFTRCRGCCCKVVVRETYSLIGYVDRERRGYTGDVVSENRKLNRLVSAEGSSLGACLGSTLFPSNSVLTAVGQRNRA